MPARKHQSGVTLVETLVALAVMGFVIGALMVLVGQNSRFAASLRDRTFASIAADNLMVRAMIAQEALQTGESAGDVAIGGVTMRYRRNVVETGVEDIVRIEVTVLDAETDQALARATSMRRPQ